MYAKHFCIEFDVWNLYFLSTEAVGEWRGIMALQGSYTIISILLLKDCLAWYAVWCISVALRVKALFCAKRAEKHTVAETVKKHVRFVRTFGGQFGARTGCRIRIDLHRRIRGAWAQQKEDHKGESKEGPDGKNPGWCCWTFWDQLQNPSYILLLGISSMTNFFILTTSNWCKEPHLHDYCVRAELGQRFSRHYSWNLYLFQAGFSQMIRDRMFVSMQNYSLNYSHINCLIF